MPRQSQPGILANSMPRKSQSQRCRCPEAARCPGEGSHIVTLCHTGWGVQVSGLQVQPTNGESFRIPLLSGGTQETWHSECTGNAHRSNHPETEGLPMVALFETRRILTFEGRLLHQRG